MPNRNTSYMETYATEADDLGFEDDVDDVEEDCVSPAKPQHKAQPKRAKKSTHVMAKILAPRLLIEQLQVRVRNLDEVLEQYPLGSIGGPLVENAAALVYSVERLLELVANFSAAKNADAAQGMLIEQLLAEKAVLQKENKKLRERATAAEKLLAHYTEETTVRRLLTIRRGRPK